MGMEYRHTHIHTIIQMTVTYHLIVYTKNINHLGPLYTFILIY